jgi:hypothetical protein
MQKRIRIQSAQYLMKFCAQNGTAPAIWTHCQKCWAWLGADCYHTQPYSLLATCPLRFFYLSAKKARKKELEREKKSNQK